MKIATNNDACILTTEAAYVNEESIEKQDKTNQFYYEVIAGLLHTPKKLPSKYFYDAMGDLLFQQIMHSSDYYLTRSELEIFTTKLSDITQLLLKDPGEFDLIELGPGDAYKSVHLMKELTRLQAVFNYIPIDISGTVLDLLDNTLPNILPNMPINRMQGEYFPMLSKVNKYSNRRKVILCLGANIGNMSITESYSFCQSMRQYLQPGDQVIMGFDLVKNPNIIRAAYNDRDGFTRKFNLNLLTRINRELNANFNLEDFEHYCSYEPETGSCKSYLVCLADRTVCINDTEITFKKDEYIWMEISQKHTLKQIDKMAKDSGFKPIVNIMDNKKWFVDACWEVI